MGLREAWGYGTSIPDRVYDRSDWLAIAGDDRGRPHEEVGEPGDRGRVQGPRGTDFDGSRLAGHQGAGGVAIGNRHRHWAAATVLHLNSGVLTVDSANDQRCRRAGLSGPEQVVDH